MNDVPAEIRGLRKLVGLFVIVQFTKWYLTGEFWVPLVNQVSEATYGSPLEDGLDIISTLVYVVGTITCLAAEQIWNLICHIFSIARDRFSGARWIADLLNRGTDTQAEVSSPSLTDTLNQMIDKLNQLEARVDATGSMSTPAVEVDERPNVADAVNARIGDILYLPLNGEVIRNAD